jgi:hypothetical protein
MSMFQPFISCERFFFIPVLPILFPTLQQPWANKCLVVLPFETVDNWSSLCKPISDRFFHQGAVQTGHLILEKCSIRGLLLVPSSTCPVLATEDIRSGKQMGSRKRNGCRACDFLQVTDIFFRPLFAFFLIELRSRKVIHVGVTSSPTDAWVAQQLREATPYGQAPKYLIRDNDSKFGSCFARVATTSAIEILKTPVHAPRANVICERFLRSVRQECLDHLLIFHEKQHEPRAQCLCGLLQPGTTPSRHWAADPCRVGSLKGHSA